MSKHSFQPEDIRVPTASNPLRFKQLVVESERLSFDKAAYSFADVKRIGFKWVKNVKIGLGESQDMSLSFDISGRSKRINLSITGIVYHPIRSIKQKHNDLYSIYAYLAQKSFPHRANDYLADLDRLGYFDFNGCRIYPDGRVMREKVSIKINEPGVKLSPFMGNILVTRSRPSKGGLSERVFGPGKDALQIPLDVDKDILTALLRQFLDVRLYF